MSDCFCIKCSKALTNTEVVCVECHEKSSSPTIRSYRYSEIHLLKPGEVARDPDTGTYYARTPNGHLANLRDHTVTDHRDGTVTVSPSISVSWGDLGGEVYHGHLERGAWRLA